MRRRLPALSALGVVGVVVAAATAGSGVAPAQPQIIVAGPDDVTVVRVAPATDGAEPVTTTPATTASTVASDDTVPPLVPAVTAPGPAQLPGFDGPAFSAAIADRLLAQGAYAVSIAVAKDGHLIWSSGHGTANVWGEPVTATHRFRIASNSKMLTAATVLSLVDEGVVGLDEPVLERVAEQFGVELGDERMRTVTVRQLLSHTSGFDDFQAEFFRERAVGCEDVTIEALRGRLIAAPGTRVNYSNENFCFLGLLIEHLTGEGYEQAVYDRLLTPLGITDMRVSGNDDLRGGEVDHPGGTERNFMEVLGGAGAWLASAADMVRIVDSFDTSRPGWHPFSAELGAQMRGDGEAQAFARAHHFGLGLRLWDDGSWGHTGTIQNAHSMVLHRPDGITFAILVSGSVPAESDDLVRYADRAFAVAPVPDAPLVVEEPQLTPLDEQLGLRPSPSQDGGADQVRTTPS